MFMENLERSEVGMHQQLPWMTQTFDLILGQIKLDSLGKHGEKHMIVFLTHCYDEGQGKPE